MGKRKRREGGGDGGSGCDCKINRRYKGEYCRALTNAQRMPVSIRPSQTPMRGKEATVYVKQGYSLKLSARLQSEPRGLCPGSCQLIGCQKAKEENKSLWLWYLILTPWNL